MSTKERSLCDLRKGRLAPDQFWYLLSLLSSYGKPASCELWIDGNLLAKHFLPFLPIGPSRTA